MPLYARHTRKANWNLYLEGDKENRPKILNEVTTIDIFHYDSDKSYVGRKYAMEAVKGKLAKDALVLFADINDNTHFYDYVTENRCTDYSVFKFEQKYIGLIGKVD